MPTLKDRQNTDDHYNPSAIHAREQFEGEQNASPGSHESIPGYDRKNDILNDHPISAGIADASDPSRNIASTKNKEETANQFGWNGNKRAVAAAAPIGRKAKIKGLAKKFGPTGGILGLIVAVLFGGGVFMSPALALVHLKEVFTEDLNDQFAAMDIRTNYIWRAKMNSLGKTGVCTGVKIRCGLAGMNTRQLKAFEKAGIKIEKGTKNPLTGKTEVKSMTFTLASGEERTVNNAAEARRIVGDKGVKNQLRRAYNPLFYSIRDKTSWKSWTRHGTNPTSRINGDSDEERNRSLQDNIEGTESKLNPSPRPGGDTEEEQRDAARRTADDESRISEIGESSSTKTLLARSALSATGTMDMLCTVYNTSQAIEGGAKVIRERQLARYAVAVNNTADKIKAGVAKPAEVEFVANKLGKVSTATSVLDETTGKTKPNPNLGKTGYDSAGAKAAFYNDAPTLTAQDSQFTIGGGMVGTLASINAIVTSKLGGSRQEIRDKCGLVQNVYVRGASLIVGIGLGAFSGGSSVALGVAASAAVAVALPILTAYLRDMTAGTTATSETEGVDAGNATFAGTSALLGDMAMGRGMQPANAERMQEYQAAATNVKNEYIAAETDAARDTPFDVMNQYSFLGSLARGVAIPVQTSGSALTTLSSVIGAPLRMTAKASAVGDFNPERFSKCNDDGYKELGIDADIFCNVRYAMSSTELNMDPGDTIDWMIERGHITDDGAPQSEDYREFMNSCTNEDTSEDRVGGWGTTTDDDGDADLGINCMDGKSKWSIETLQHFRSYTIDYSIQDGMDNGIQEPTIETEGGTELRIATFNVLGSNHDDRPGIDKWPERIQRSAEVIQGKGIEVVGFQEFTPVQQTRMDDLLPDYDRWPKGEGKGVKSDDGIMWDTGRFDRVDQGSWNTRYSGPIKEPWVKLSDKESGQQFYVMSLHDPVDSVGGSNAIRAENVRKHLEKVQELNAKAPVFIVGDFNGGMDKDTGAGYSSAQDSAYCKFTSSGDLNHAFDLTKGRTAKCPNDLDGSANVDHIYMTKEVLIDKEKEGYGIVNPGPRNGRGNGSDHPTVYADAIIPGEGTAPVPYKNPVYNGNVPDPSVIRDDEGTYYVYATGGTKLSSKDLVSWKKAGSWMPANAPADIKRYDKWAPDVAKVGDKYILTFSSVSGNGRNIVYGVGDKASGPFRYKGVLVRSGEFGQPDSKGTIDSHIFVEGNNAYLFFGGGIISAVKINVRDDGTINMDKGSRKMLLLKRPGVTTIEGSWLHKKGDWYYLFYSQGNWEYRGPNPNEYSVRVARSKSIMGPFTPEGGERKILSGKDPFRGPGHNSITQDNAGNDWMVYHAWSGGNRALMIDPITYEDGWPKVRNGYPSSGMQQDGPANGEGKEGSGSSGDFAWPLGKEYWNSARSEHLDSHTASTGTAWGADNMGTSSKGAGIAVDIGSPAGKPVYSMFDGKVTSTSLCGSNDGIAIKSNMGSGTVGVAYMHGTNKKFKVGDTVKAGDRIMDVGTIGCRVYGAHLHIGIAYNGKYVCPQDVFVAGANGNTFNWNTLAQKGVATCGGRKV